MNINLPRLNRRSTSRTKIIIKPHQIFENHSISGIKNDLNRSSIRAMSKKVSKSSAGGSLSPIHFKSKSPTLSHYKLLPKLEPLFLSTEKIHAKESFNPKVLRKKKLLHSNVIKALMSMSAGRKEVPGLVLTELFLGLGYSSDRESLDLILKANSLNPFLCSFSKIFLKSLLSEEKIDNSFQTILKESKETFASPQTLDNFIKILKKWWSRIGYSKNGFIPSEDVCKFLIRLDLFESSSEVKKAFENLSSYMSFKQFLGIFSKSLLKFLLLRLCEDVVDRKIIPADIELNAIRRERMLNGFSEDNQAVASLINHYSHAKNSLEHDN